METKCRSVWPCRCVQQMLVMIVDVLLFSFDSDTAMQASSSSLSLLPPPFSSMAVKHGPCLLTLKKGSRLSKPSAWGNFFSISPTWSTRPMTWCRARSTSLWVHRNLFWQLSRDGILLGSGRSHTTTASPKPSFSSPGRWATPWSQRKCWMDKTKSGHPTHARTVHKGLQQKRPEEDLCWFISHIPVLSQLCYAHSLFTFTS